LICCRREEQQQERCRVSVIIQHAEIVFVLLKARGAATGAMPRIAVIIQHAEIVFVLL
jgi:hypothetical protein